MKRNRILTIVFILVGASVYLFWSNSYVKFKPIQFDGDKFYAIKPDAGFNTNLKVVLKDADVAYKEDASGRILIKRKISNDEELVWNFTSRALDSSWLNSRRVHSGN